MGSQFFPIIGGWYRDQADQIFEVVALDEEEDQIEIQYFEGEIDELDLEAWNALGVESIPPPEDWSGAFDLIGGVDDFGYSDPSGRASIHTYHIDDIE